MLRTVFNGGLSPSDPVNVPVMILGQHQHLAMVDWDVIKVKLEPRVTRETWTAGVASLSPTPTDVGLYMNLATVGALPVKVSRHNTQSRAHSITKLVKSLTSGSSEAVVVVVRHEDVYASGCAVARAYSLYNKKTVGDQPNVQARQAREVLVSVEFLIVDDNTDTVSPSVLSKEDRSVLESSSEAIHLTARLVDTPCNEMNTDHFVEEAKMVASKLGIVPTIIRGEELRERGLGGIYGVGKAAANPPALVVLTHKPADSNKSIAWVGKGIVYDTGGLSIKVGLSTSGVLCSR